MLYVKITYSLMFYVPFVFVIVFSIATAVKIFLIQKNRASVMGKICFVNLLNDDYILRSQRKKFFNCEVFVETKFPHIVLFGK